MTPGVQVRASSEEAPRWATCARAVRPLLKPAFPHTLSPGDSQASALLRCEQANVRLRTAPCRCLPLSQTIVTCALGWIGLERASSMAPSAKTSCLTRRCLSVRPPRWRSPPYPLL
eukprot:4080277-Pleurochrysis_carterae.AAC.1